MNVPPCDHATPVQCANVIDSMKTHLETQGKWLICESNSESCIKIHAKSLFEINLIFQNFDESVPQGIECFFADGHISIAKIKHFVATRIHIPVSQLDVLFASRLAKDTDNPIDAFNCNGRGGERLQIIQNKWV
ncbi:MAG: hypothetical protein Q8K75_02680 [Chlamydiales bacterium]|nr:hypothetical protein [Chlamydiales bacterium]